MKVILQTGDRMQLRGIPQGRGLLFGVLVCLGIAIVAGLFTYMQWTRSKSIWPVVPPAIGVVFMAFLMTCLVLLSFKREQLTLDKVTKTVDHETWSLLKGSRKKKTYPFERVHGVAVERSLQAPGGGKGFPIRVTKARLLISKPRRAIDMDEVQSGDPAAVEDLAAEVAAFLDKPLEAMGSHDDDPPRRRKRRSRD